MSNEWGRVAMDELLKVALAGTSRTGGQLPPPAMPTDALVAPADDRSVERRVLLLAGARAIYRRAGTTPRAGAAPRAAAPADPLPVCPPDAARLLAGLLAGDQAELLPEALERLRLAGWRLPHALLPMALEVGTRKGELRPALLATIGERGRWLAGHNQPWRWALVRPLTAASALPDNAETLWQEGTPAQRLAILRQMRAHDAARSRAWLAAAWMSEKADFRAEALGVLAQGLSLADEPFLEAALDDRSQAVRAEAARLLARLPDSALALRLRQRADRWLSFAPGLLAGGLRAAARALTRGAAAGKLKVSPPEGYDQAWARDGIAEKPPQGTGERAWWLQQFLALIPPAHWSGQAKADPLTLIAAAEQGEWTAVLLTGWEQATLLHRDAAWAATFWRYWGGTKLDRMRQDERGRTMGELAECLSQDRAEQLVLDALGQSPDLDYRWVATLHRLPRPWSVAFGQALLRRLRAHCEQIKQQGSAAHYNDPWVHSLGDLALALPRECFSEALAIQARFADGADPATAGWWQRNIDNFGELIRTRQRLMKELPL